MLSFKKVLRTAILSFLAFAVFAGIFADLLLLMLGSVSYTHLKIKEEIAVYASRNYTGVHIKKNTKMYIGKNQNRFMLLQHPNGFIELYECIAYRELNNQRIYKKTHGSIVSFFSKLTL